MRNIKYTVENISLTNGDIIDIGTRDKYSVLRDPTPVLKVFRYSDGRTINEKHTYEIIVQDSDDTDVVYIRTDDIILDVWHIAPDTLIILRPIFRR